MQGGNTAWRVQATHRIEFDELGDVAGAHDGDGLIHAARLGAHILLADGREGGYLLYRQMGNDMVRVV